MEDILDFIPQGREGEVIYFNPDDRTHPIIGFNVFEGVNTEGRHMIASGLISVFKKL